MTNELIRDLQKAGAIIGQYQEFHHKLKDTLYKPLSIEINSPEMYEYYKIDKDDYEIFQKLKSLIYGFTIAS